MFTKLAILISQTLNVLFGGEEDEMLSSRCWRLKDVKFWGILRILIDNTPPLSLWRSEGMTHCESCYYAEKDRLTKRMKDFEVK